MPRDEVRIEKDGEIVWNRSIHWARPRLLNSSSRAGLSWVRTIGGVRHNLHRLRAKLHRTLHDPQIISFLSHTCIGFYVAITSCLVPDGQRICSEVRLECVFCWRKPVRDGNCKNILLGQLKTPAVESTLLLITVNCVVVRFFLKKPDKNI